MYLIENEMLRAFIIGDDICVKYYSVKWLSCTISSINFLKCNPINVDIDIGYALCIVEKFDK